MNYDPLNPRFQMAFPSGNIQSWRRVEDAWSSRIAWVAVTPQGTREETRTAAVETLKQVVRWLKTNTDTWSAQDRLAVVVGLPPGSEPSSNRRIAHGWVEVGRLAEVVGLDFGKAGGGFEFSPGWTGDTVREIA